MKPKRSIDYKIPDIKVYRRLTYFLERLQVPNVFGLGLKEAKDYVEGKWDYGYGSEYQPEYGKISWTSNDKPNRIAMIRDTRRLGKFLYNLKIDTGTEMISLTAAKDFVLRRYPIDPKHEY